jgi:glutamate synthase (NADPH/NADH) small chain
MDFLPQQNRRVAGLPVDPAKDLVATGKHVIIIGGGDTGADCLGTTRRQGAKSIRQFELLPKPPLERDEPGAQPWPLWPFTFKSESSHVEGDVRDWSVNTKEFIGDADGNVRALTGVRLRWQEPDPDTGRRAGFKEVPDSEFEVSADLVLLAMGFLHPVQEGLIAQLDVAHVEVYGSEPDPFSSAVDRVLLGQLATLKAENARLRPLALAHLLTRTEDELEAVLGAGVPEDFENSIYYVSS